MRLTLFLTLCTAFCSALLQTPPADDPRPAARWPLEKDCRCDGPATLHGENHGVRFGNVGMGKEAVAAAIFSGKNNHIVIPQAKSWQPGGGDFSIAAWIHTDAAGDDDLGDIFSRYDPVRRIGVNLSLRCNTGVTHSQPNDRQLQFGIDAGSEPVWIDEGRPGNAMYGFALAVHDGRLFAGTCEPGKEETGRVYQYMKAGHWRDLGRLDGANAVSSLASLNGHLYAGTARYRLAGSSLPESPNATPGGGIFRYDERKGWTDCGRLPNCEAVGGLVTYRGRLYASSLYRPAGFWIYEGGTNWSPLATPGGKRAEALRVQDGELWATGYDDGHIYRFDGEKWTDDGRVGASDQTYAFAAYQGGLCIATWPGGRVFRRQPTGGFSDMGRLGNELEVMGMLVHNGKLYGGTLPSGEVYRHDGDTRWTRVGRLDNTKNVKYRRVWTMAQFQGRLFCTTLPSGRIHSMEAGKCVTWDKELPAGWRHIVALRKGDRLRLYVDGVRVAESSAMAAGWGDINTDQRLRIGAGAGDSFKGALRDVALYHRALTQGEIERMALPQW